MMLSTHDLAGALEKLRRAKIVCPCRKHGKDDLALCIDCNTVRCRLCFSNGCPCRPETPLGIRAHAAGCPRALSVPVDRCDCGGRDV